MNRRRVGEDRGSKEMDGCPLTTPTSVKHSNQYTYTRKLTYFGV
jgi:hypothetical protein